MIDSEHTRTQVWIGIDPGVTGAFAAIRGSSCKFYDMPTIEVATGKKRRNDYDVQGVISILNEASRNAITVTVAIERQQAMPDQGVSSTFKTGLGFGILIGVLSALELPFELVAPVSWKKALMADMPKDKGASIVKAKQLFPWLAGDLSRKKDHARADALLIAEYARRRQLAIVR